MTTVEDRAAGAIMGALIGDGLGLGCHWYYDIEELKREHGEWITDYTTPKQGQFHYGCKAGDVSQSGQLYQFLLETLNEKGEYDEEDFTSRMDALLATLDGTSQGGRYTQKDMIDVWENRMALKKPWSECASPFGDTTDSCVRAVALAARYHNDLPTLANKIASNTRLQYQDRQIRVHSIAFGLTVACLISGMEYGKIGMHLISLVKEGKIPQNTPDPDSLLWSTSAANAVAKPNLLIEPARDAPQMHGIACAFYMVMPGAYYLAARFPNDFETAVLTAVNSGGQNLARASLTGGMVGAMTGLSSIPERFITGLSDSDKWCQLAKKIAQQALK